MVNNLEYWSITDIPFLDDAYLRTVLDIVLVNHDAIQYLCHFLTGGSPAIDGRSIFSKPPFQVCMAGTLPSDEHGLLMRIFNYSLSLNTCGIPIKLMLTKSTHYWMSWGYHQANPHDRW